MSVNQVTRKQLSWHQGNNDEMINNLGLQYYSKNTKQVIESPKSLRNFRRRGQIL